MKLSIRIFLAYFILLGFAIWFVMRSFSAELVPGMRQSIEEVLVDTANLLAELVAAEMVDGSFQIDKFSNTMNRFAGRRLDARIWFLKKRDPNMVVYITDARGQVIYHSNSDELGKDYSQWNDVYLTLHGEYGARTSQENPDDSFSSIMYVAAPIIKGGETVGVVSVGKPSIVVQPFVERMLANIEEKSVLMILVAMGVGLLLTYWLTFSIRRLTIYAQDVRNGRRPEVPKLGEQELAELAEAMDAMRIELEGKNYVENYLHSLTHELKSPLAAIQGTAELLNEELPKADHNRFVGNLRNEAARLHQVVEQLLRLAAVEKQQNLIDPVQVDTLSLIESLCEDRQWRVRPIEVGFVCELSDKAKPVAERFLLQQALSNLIDNAIDFSPQGGIIEIRSWVEDTNWVFSVRDEGPGIPDYASQRVFERFYSLPRPSGGRRSSGLGLSFVREVAILHGGKVSVVNDEAGGAIARLVIPLNPSV